MPFKVAGGGIAFCVLVMKTYGVDNGFFQKVRPLVQVRVLAQNKTVSHDFSRVI
jgi:hypothetical protein